MIFHFHHQQTGGESPPDAVKCGNLTCVNLGSEVIIVMMMIMIIQVMMMTIIMITRVMIMCTIWYDNSLEDLKSHSCYEVDTQSYRSSNAFARVRNATQRVNCQPVVIQRFLLPSNHFYLIFQIWRCVANGNLPSNHCHTHGHLIHCHQNYDNYHNITWNINLEYWSKKIHNHNHHNIDYRSMR